MRRGSPKPVVIIGGGLSGVVAALRIKEQGIPFVLLEKESALGGLTRTDTVETDGQSFKFDQTGHFLHFQNEQIKEYCRPYLEEAAFKETKKKAGAISEYCEAICPAPFQYHLRLFNEEIKKNIQNELIALRNKLVSDSSSNESVINFETFVKQRFGETLSDLLLSYNRKLYGPQVGGYAADQMGSYLPDNQLSPLKLIDKLLESVNSPKEDDSYNATFYYSTSGSGIQGFFNALTAALKKDLPDHSQIITSCCVTKIDMEKRKVFLSARRPIDYYQIINSMPLKNLCESLSSSGASKHDDSDLFSGLSIASIKALGKKLKSQSVNWLQIGIQHSGTSTLDGYHWLYDLRPRSSFYRMGAFSNVDRKMSPEGFASIWVELSNTASMENAKQEVRLFLLERGWIKKADDILFMKEKAIPVAYVLKDGQCDLYIADILDTLDRHSIYSIGRYGSWRYSSMGRDIEKAFKVAGQAATKACLSCEELCHINNYEKGGKPNFRKKIQNALGANFTELYRQLEQHGIVRIHPFSQEHINEMKEDAQKWLKDRSPDSAKHILWDGANPGKSPFLPRSEALSKAACDPTALSLASCLWGDKVKASYVRTYWIGPMNRFDPQAHERAFAAHIDGHSKSVRVMILLNDTPSEGQTMKFWLGTHTILWNAIQSLETRYNEDETRKIAGEPVNCHGPAGTTFIFNSNGIHRGTRNKNGDRMVLVVTLTRGKKLFTIPGLYNDGKGFPHTDILRYVWRQLSVSPTITDETYISSLQKYVKSIDFTCLQAVNDQWTFYGTGAALAFSPKKLLTISRTKPTPVYDATGSVTHVEFFDRFLTRSLNLPIRMYDDRKDTNRDLGFGYIRDVWWERTETKQRVTKIVEAAGLPADALPDLKEYQNIKVSIQACLRKTIPQPDTRAPCLAFNIMALINDMCVILCRKDEIIDEHCSAWIFLFLALDYFNQTLVPSNKLEPLMNQVALCINIVRLSITARNVEKNAASYLRRAGAFQLPVTKSGSSGGKGEVIRPNRL